MYNVLGAYSGDPIISCPIISVYLLWITGSVKFPFSFKVDNYYLSLKVTHIILLLITFSYIIMSVNLCYMDFFQALGL